MLLLLYASPAIGRPVPSDSVFPPVLALPLLTADPGPHTAVGHGAKECPDVQHTEQVAQLAGQRRGQEAEHPQGRRKEAEILHPDGDHEEQQQLYLRVQHGKGQQQRKGQTVSAGRHAGKQAGQHRAHHAQQEIEGIAEIAPLLFQRRAHEPGKVDAQHHAEDAAAGEGDEHKGDRPPDLPLQQEKPVQAHPGGDGAVDKQLNGKDKDLPRYQNVGQVWNAEAPIFALQLVQPIVHASCLQKLMFHACLRLLYHDWTGLSRKNRHSGAVCTPAGKNSGRYSKMQPHSGPFHNKKGWCFSIPERTFHFFHRVFH